LDGVHSARHIVVLLVHFVPTQYTRHSVSKAFRGGSHSPCRLGDSNRSLALQFRRKATPAFVVRAVVLLTRVGTWQAGEAGSGTESS
jgi:hypothetical protein